MIRFFHFINNCSTFSIFNHRVSFFNKSTCYLNEAQSPVELCWCGDSRAHFSHGAFAHSHTRIYIENRLYVGGALVHSRTDHIITDAKARKV